MFDGCSPIMNHYVQNWEKSSESQSVNTKFNFGIGTIAKLIHMCQKYEGKTVLWDNFSNAENMNKNVGATWELPAK